MVSLGEVGWGADVGLAGGAFRGCTNRWLD
jgi:hypothetical protein